MANEPNILDNIQDPADKTSYMFKQDLDKIKAETKKNMKKIRSFVESKSMDLDTSRADVAEDVAIMTLQEPIRQMQKEMEQLIISGEVDLNTVLERYRGRMEDVVQIAEGYVLKVIQDSGWVDAEALAKMTKDAGKDLGKMMNLLNEDNPDSKELADAFRYTMRALSKENDMVVARKKTFDFMIEKLKSKEYTPMIWTIMTYMDRKDRIDLTREYFAAISSPDAQPPLPPSIIEEFLKEGNHNGVFSITEMEELRGGKKYEEKEREVYIAKWQLQNSHQGSAKLIARQSYGTVNHAGKWLSGPNILMFIAHKSLITQIAGNVITDVFQGGKPKSFEGIMAAVTKPHVLAAGAGLVAIKMAKDPRRLAQILEPKDQRETHERSTAYARLSNQVNGNPLWDEWETFFKTENYAGVDVFKDFIDWAQIETKTEKLDDDFRELINPRVFKEYLAHQIEKQKAGKIVPRPNIDYEKVAEKFNNIETKELLDMAKIVDVLGAKMRNEQDFNNTVKLGLNHTSPTNTVDATTPDAPPEPVIPTT
ncbi:MAG: hypothetical protein AAB373_02980 [Patescibacteria group bacterium]